MLVHVQAILRSLGELAPFAFRWVQGSPKSVPALELVPALKKLMPLADGLTKATFSMTDCWALTDPFSSLGLRLRGVENPRKQRALLHFYPKATF